MEPKNFWKEMQRLCKQRGGTCDDSECGYDCPLCALPCCAAVVCVGMYIIKRLAMAEKAENILLESVAMTLPVEEEP